MPLLFSIDSIYRIKGRLGLKLYYPERIIKLIKDCIVLCTWLGALALVWIMGSMVAESPIAGPLLVVGPLALCGWISTRIWKEWNK